MKWIFLSLISLSSFAQVQTDIVVNCRAQDKAYHVFVVKNQGTLKASVHDWDDFLVGYYDVELNVTQDGIVSYRDKETSGQQFLLVEPKNQSGFYTLKAQTNVGGEDYSIGRFNLACVMFTRSSAF